MAASLPTIAFVLVHWLAASVERGLMAALIASLATLAWSWRFPQLRKAAFGGLLAATGTAIAARTRRVWRDQVGWLAATHVQSGPIWAVLVGATVITARGAIRES